MNTVIASKLTAKEIKKSSVLVPFTCTTRNKQGEAFRTKVVIVATDRKGYRVGYKNRETGKIEKVARFATLAEVKANYSGSL